jgi:hypothetical protein
MIASLNPLRPYMPLIGLVALLAYGGGMYWWGGSNARNACAAANGKASAKVEQTEDKRDANIEEIATAAARATAAELNLNRGQTDESTDRIRTVVVPGACRTVDPGIVRELRQARDDANAALGIRMRPGATEPAATDP